MLQIQWNPLGLFAWAQSITSSLIAAGIHWSVTFAVTQINLGARVTVLTKKLPLDSSAITVLGHGGNHIFIPNCIGIHWSTDAIHYGGDGSDKKASTGFQCHYCFRTWRKSYIHSKFHWNPLEHQCNPLRGVRSKLAMVVCSEAVVSGTGFGRKWHPEMLTTGCNQNINIREVVPAEYVGFYMYLDCQIK